MTDEVLLVVGHPSARWASATAHRPVVTRGELAGLLRAALLPSQRLAAPEDITLLVGSILVRLARDEPGLSATEGRGFADRVRQTAAAITRAHELLVHDALLAQPHAKGPPDRARGGSDSGLRVLSSAARELERALGALDLAHPASESALVAAAVSRSRVEAVVGALGATQIRAVATASWTPADLVLFRALDAKLSTVKGAATVALPVFERPLDAERPPDPLGRLIDAVAEALDAAPVPLPISAPLGDLTDAAGGSPASRERVTLARADTRVTEAAAIAARVREALASAPPERVQVVVPPGSPLSALVARALTADGVPVTVDVEGLEELSGLATFALAALAVAGAERPRLPLASLLASPYVDAASLLALSDREEAVRRVRLLVRALEATPSASGEGPFDGLVATVLSYEAFGADHRPILEVTIRRVASLFAGARDGRTRAELAKSARALFEGLGLAAVPSRGLRTWFAADGAFDRLESAELDAYARDLRGWHRLAGALARAGRPELDGPMTLPRFHAELDGVLRASEGVTGAGGSAVRICSLDRAVPRPTTLLVVGDLAEGAMDPEVAEGSLFPDVFARQALLESLEPALRAVVPLGRDAWRVALALLAHEAEHVLLSSSARAEDGTLRAPHPVLGRLAREGIPVETLSTTTFIPPLRAGDPLAESVATRARVEAAREAAFGLPSSLQSASAAAFPSSAQAKMLVATGGGERPMPVTALDRFGACRFQGFAAQVLRVRAPRAVDDVVDALEEGTLLHGALAAAFEATKALWAARPRDADAIRREAAAAAASALGRLPAGSPLRRVALSDLVVTAMRVVEWSLGDESWDFAEAEARFGMGRGSWDPLVLRDGPASVTLRGSADRVDLAHGGAGLRVVDYKRSEESARRLTSDLGETGFQLAVYGEAAARHYGVAARSGVYLPTRRLAASFKLPKAEERWRDANEREPREPTAEPSAAPPPRFARRVLALLDGVRNGEVFPEPAQLDLCERCDFDAVCRKPRFVIRGSLEETLEERGRVD